MTRPRLDPELLLDQPPLTADELRELEGLAARTAGTTNDVVLLQAEAILALEAIARSVAAPGIRALNLVSGPYGGVFGQWMRESGADVAEVTVPFDEVLSGDRIAERIARERPEVVSVVHAEAATGGTNPVAEIVAAARAVGALTVVDAVASIGAEPVTVDAWGIDIAAFGAQKALAGPAGVSAVSVSDRAWGVIDRNERAPRGSSLSLLDWRDRWLRTDRDAIPGMPSWLESRALGAALRRVQEEGLPAVQERHRRASRAAVAGVEALGLSPWQRTATGRAPVVTTVRLPDAAGTRAVPAVPAVPGGILAAGDGVLRGRLLRVNHTGRAADLEAVRDAIGRLAALVGGDAAEADEAARDGWDG